MTDKAGEMTNIIYDTIMDNIGMSEHHIGLNLNRVENQFCDAANNRISFEYFGNSYEIIIKRIC